MLRVWGAVVLSILAGCSVNKAVVDPFAFAPEETCWYWCPDKKASELRCEESFDCCYDLPDEDHPLSLAEVLDISLVNSPQTQISWAQAREAAAQYGLSQSSFFPQISADFYFTRDRTAYLTSQVEQQQNINKEMLLINTQSQYGPQTHLTWTLLDFGQRRYTSEAARYALYYANFTHNDTIQLLVETATLGYYQYLYEVKLLEANEADLANALETLAAANLGLETGAKDVSDVLQARTQVLLAEITLSEQRKAVKTAYANLLDIMGLPANCTIAFDKLPYIDPNEVELDSLDIYLCYALASRPDLLAERSAEKSAEMNLQMAKRLWTPVLDYSLEVGRTYFSGGFHDDYDFTSTFTLSMPLFTGFEIRNTIRSATAKVESAQGSVKQIELDVIRDVTTAHFNVGVALDTLKAANKYLLATKEEYDVALAQYRAGVNTILDLISALSSLFDARAKQAEAIQQWFSTLATLTYSAGLFSKHAGGYPCE